MMLNIPSQKFQQMIEKQTFFDDARIIPHLSHILQIVKNQENQISNNQLDLVDLSNIVKQTKLINDNKRNNNTYIKQKISYSIKQQKTFKKQQYQIKNFLKQSQKLHIAGISLGQQTTSRIHSQLISLMPTHNLNSGRFWGKILGISKDYYIIQAYKQPPKQHITIKLGSQKPGEGVNYYSYFVTNDVFSSKWEELPLITINQVKTAREMKRMFIGELNAEVKGYPKFDGLERHYLKAQLVRITHSLQLSPKGIYKVNDQNPKVIQYQQQVKIPQYSQLSTLQGWVHKNPMILSLGRCTHFIDPSLPQSQIQTQSARLAQQDPQIQRLRVITQDKPAGEIPEGGLQSYWMIKTMGNNQIFPKDEAQNVYGVIVMKNVLWPGWVTIGYANGYCNFYLGDGLKASQACWNTFANPNIQEQGEDIVQFNQPNPKELPKVEQPQGEQNQENQQGNGEEDNE